MCYHPLVKKKGVKVNINDVEVFGVVFLELFLFAGNDKLDAELVATTTTQRGTEDGGAAEVNDNKSTGPPTRPQPPVRLMFSPLSSH